MRWRSWCVFVSFSGSFRTAANLYQETFPLSKKKSGLWSFLKSVKLTLVLLTLIIILAVVGTLVPQREAAFELSDRLSPTLWAFLSKAQIFDLYHSIWFFALMGLFALNLIVCSIDRFPEAWRRFRRRPAPDDPDVTRYAGDHPLRVRATGVVPSDTSATLVVSDDDALAIAAAEAVHSFLCKCRVVVLVSDTVEVTP